MIQTFPRLPGPDQRLRDARWARGIAVATTLGFPFGIIVSFLLGAEAIVAAVYGILAMALAWVAGISLWATLGRANNRP